MTALKDLWQQQRLQRQQELAQRQQDVQHTISQMEQDRLAKAAELRDDLQLFHLALNQQTQSFLDHLGNDRQQKAQALRQNLRDANAQRKDDAAMFMNELRDAVDDLKSQTQRFLSLIYASQQLDAEELFRNLRLFHTNLSASVAELRHRLHLELQARREEVQLYLSDCQQKRMQEHVQLVESLSAYVQGLKTEVGDYLTQLGTIDQERAQELTKQFQTQRQARVAEMEELFEDLAIFRGELREYRTNLHSMVWGDGSFDTSIADEPATQVTAPVVSTPQSAPQSNPVAPNGRSLQTAPAKAPPTTATTPTPVVAPSPNPVPVAPPSTSPRSLVESSPAIATPDTITATVGDSVNDARVKDKEGSGKPFVTTSWGNTSVTLPRKAMSEVESEIFGYLQAGDGARLTEIEAALDINRFQAVDALRSLIKQGRVTQRDRVYVIQEETTP